MSWDSHYDKKSGVNSRHWDEDSETTTGGQGGQLAYRDAFKQVGERRDDQLSPEEQRIKLAEHSRLSEKNIKNGKEVREKYQEGRTNQEKASMRARAQGHLGYGGGAGASSSMPAHPRLVNTVQFGSGINDPRKTSPAASETDAKTNEAERDVPKNEYNKQYKPEMVPHFNPTPTITTPKPPA